MSCAVLNWYLAVAKNVGCKKKDISEIRKSELMYPCTLVSQKMAKLFEIREGNSHYLKASIEIMKILHILKIRGTQSNENCYLIWLKKSHTHLNRICLQLVDVAHESI